MSLVGYHRLVRTLVGGDARPPAGVGDPRVYASLVRLQHRQPLLQVFGEALARKEWAAPTSGLLEAYLAHCPPRDTHPGRWAAGFAAFVSGRGEVPLALREQLDYLALRLSQSLAPDEPRCGHGTRGEPRLYTHDPRSAPLAAEEPKPPVVLLVFRDLRGAVTALVADGATLGAWGLACGECDVAELGERGITGNMLRAAEQRLRRAGHPLFESHDGVRR
jgi:hypothetical protein